MAFDGFQIKTTHDKLSAEEKARKKAYFEAVRAEKVEKTARVAKKKPKTYKPRDFSWKILAGITVPAEKLSAYVRYADLDKKARISFNNAQTLLSPYVDFNTMKKVGKKQYIRSAYMSMMFDIDSNVSVQQLTDVLNGFQFSYVTGKEIAPGVYERPHLLIWLKYPVMMDPQAHKPVEIQARQRADFRRFEDIEAYIVEKLKAAGIKIDKGQKTFTKNPDADCWDSVQCYQGDRTLREIEEALGMKTTDASKTKKTMTFSYKSPFTFKIPKSLSGIRVHANAQTPPLLTEDVLAGRTAAVVAKVNSFGFRISKAHAECAYKYDSRNETIFNEVRFIAYKFRMQHRNATAEDIYEFIEKYAHDLNSIFSDPLDSREVGYILTSITKYCTSGDFKEYDLKNRGAAKDIILDFDPTKVRQQKGALYSSYLVSKKNWEKIREHRKDFPEATKTDAARTLEMSRSTVAKYWDIQDVSEIPAVSRYKELKDEVGVIKTALYGSTSMPATEITGSVQSGVLREMGQEEKNGNYGTNSSKPSYDSDDDDAEYYELLSEYDYLNTYLEKVSYNYIKHGRQISVSFNDDWADYPEGGEDLTDEEIDLIQDRQYA